MKVVACRNKAVAAKDGDGRNLSASRPGAVDEAGDTGELLRGIDRTQLRVAQAMADSQRLGAPAKRIDKVIVQGAFDDELRCRLGGESDLT